MIDLSIVPLYRCNMHCSFCYLGSLRSDNAVLSLSALEEVIQQNELRDIDIYGGEISLLEDSYVDSMMKLLEGRHVSLVTNMLTFAQSSWRKHMFDDNVSLSFSYDKLREDIDLVKNSILEFDKTGKEYSVICIDISDLDYEFLSSCKNMKSLSIKPYSKSAYNKADFKPYMLQICQTLHCSYPQLFKKLEAVNAYRDAVPHAFLLPNGQLHDIQYEDGYELFKPLSACSYDVNVKCICCKYYRRCFNEHYAAYDAAEECLGRKNTMEYLDGIHCIH